MADNFTGQYIHAGCLHVYKDQPLIAPSLLDSCENRRWYFFQRASDNLPEHLGLPAEIQYLLLQSVLAPFASLFKQGWIRLAFSTQPVPADSEATGRIRVYLLPHDVNRSMYSLPGELTKPTITLLRQLDYSSECWWGQEYGRLPKPIKSGASVLTLFNEVPSPDPRPESVSNRNLQWAMRCLLESQVPGLISTLYPYQGRSAAIMLQRELEQDRIVDLRLHLAIDQAGRTWYYDDITGDILQDPRFYDRVRGGILAEEMGLGKTLICLALILSTKSEPTRPPDPFIAKTPPRERVGSLVDMAAAAANKHSVAWRPYFEAFKAQGYDYERCIRALTIPQNRASFNITNPELERRRSYRVAPHKVPSREVFLSYVTLIVVPSNLVKQWKNEISKHTTGLNVLILVKNDPIPCVAELLQYDIVLFSETRFVCIIRELGSEEDSSSGHRCPLEYIHFKRCIIDEGHKLGNGSRASKTDVLRVIERLEVSARWAVTGTPSRGLYGVEANELVGMDASRGDSSLGDPKIDLRLKQERVDLKRIGNLAVNYFKVRPWANLSNELGDSAANWTTYVKEYDRSDCLANTLNSLLIRHRISDVSTLLPPVKEKVVILDGSYQDQLSLNLFSMMIIFNSVQSQRTDLDYFFHERQRKSLLQLVKNLRQASFFGGVFFSAAEIVKAVETAQEFLDKGEIPISHEDEVLLKKAIEFGKLAAKNTLKDVSNRFHAMPLYLQDFPGERGKSWSLDDKEAEDGFVCTEAGLIRSLQNYLNPCIDSPVGLRLILDSGRLDQQGTSVRALALAAVSDTDRSMISQSPQAAALAGNTALGDDSRASRKSQNYSGIQTNSTAVEIRTDPGVAASPIEIPRPLAKTRIVSTVSAKLSYLIDSIVKYQDDEQILIFYDNENIAFYLASVLEIVSHIIRSCGVQY